MYGDHSAEIRSDNRKGSVRGSQLLAHGTWASACLVVGFIGTPPPAAAQEFAPPAAKGSDLEKPKLLYPADFAKFAPKTALDLLRLVPGFLIAEAEERRGIGDESGNVLINGRRISGKSNDVMEHLGRIPAQDVIRIEISDAGSLTAGGLTRQVANIIVQTKGRRGQFTWRPGVRLRNAQPSLLDGDASISGEVGRFEYTLGFRNRSLRTGANGIADIFDPIGLQTEFRDERYIEERDQPTVSANIRYAGRAGDVGNVSAMYQRLNYRFREESERSGPGFVPRERNFFNTDTNYRYEIGGDYERSIGPGRLKLIGLHSFERGTLESIVRTTFSGDLSDTGSRFRRSADRRETVFRTEYRWKSGKTDLRLSAERAVNSLDINSGLFALSPAGEFEEVPFPSGTGSVREDRSELALNIVRPLSKTLLLQATIGGEHSRLKQLGANGLSRDFYRPKGLVSLSWRASPRLRVNVTLERKIGQISFFDFLETVNLLEGRQNAANPDLVPPQSWDAEVELNRDFGKWGSTTLRLYGRLIQDLVDQIPIGSDAEAPGNLDTARAYGIEWKGTAFLDRLGLAGARIDAQMQFQGSSVKDPVTGRDRPISNNLVRRIDLSFRRDVPKSDWAYGGGVFHIRRAPDFRLGETGRFREAALAGNLFVENKDVFGLTVRASIENLISSDQGLDRTVFVNRRDGPVLFTERRRRSVGPVISLAVSGKF